MNKIILMILFSINSLFAQKKDVIYKIAFSSYPAVGYSYDISVLTLSDDNVYSFIHQQYSSKRLARKNIPFRFSKELGTWKINKDTLKLVENDNRKEMLFIILDERHLVYLFENVDRSSQYWKKINQK